MSLNKGLQLSTLKVMERLEVFFSLIQLIIRGDVHVTAGTFRDPALGLKSCVPKELGEANILRHVVV